MGQTLQCIRHCARLVEDEAKVFDLYDKRYGERFRALLCCVVPEGLDLIQALALLHMTDYCRHV